jgi:antitoxin HicB
MMESRYERRWKESAGISRHDWAAGRVSQPAWTDQIARAANGRNSRDETRGPEGRPTVATAQSQIAQSLLIQFGFVDRKPVMMHEFHDHVIRDSRRVRARLGTITNTVLIEPLDVGRWALDVCFALSVVTAQIDRFIAEDGKGPYPDMEWVGLGSGKQTDGSRHISGCIASRSATCYTCGVKFRVTIESDEDGVFVAECPALPGCISQGKTRDEAMANIRDAIQGYLESLKKHGKPIPKPVTASIVEVSVWAAL